MATSLAGKFFRRLCDHLCAFRASQGGNTAVIFALAIVPVFGAVGAAVDYSRANSVKASMQAALDATALMLAKEAATLNAGALAQKATIYFTAQFNRPEARNVLVTPEYYAVNGAYTLTLYGRASVDAAFVRILGVSELDVTTMSQVAWGSRRLELALVLDNTGSMSQYGKIDALKRATRDMLATLRDAAGNNMQIRVSIVPFDTHVNIGSSNYNKPWIDWSLYDGNGGALVRQVSYSGSSRSNWTGCVIDREQPYDVRNSAPTADSRTYHPAVQCDLTSLLPLTSDWSALDRKVGQLKSSGLTDLTIGLVWGWNMLSPNAPLSAASQPARDLDKVIVFLTDGKNTKNRWTQNQYAIDARTQAVCDNIRADGIQVFTVRVIEGNASLLRNCATKPDMYFEVSRANGIGDAFAAIADRLAKLHLSR